MAADEWNSKLRWIADSSKAHYHLCMCMCVSMWRRITRIFWTICLQNACSFFVSLSMPLYVCTYLHRDINTVSLQTHTHTHTVSLSVLACYGYEYQARFNAPGKWKRENRVTCNDLSPCVWMLVCLLECEHTNVFSNLQQVFSKKHDYSLHICVCVHTCYYWWGKKKETERFLV